VKRLGPPSSLSGGKEPGAYNETVPHLVKMLSGQLAAEVADDTGLAGSYDYTMSWVPQALHQCPSMSIIASDSHAGPTGLQARRAYANFGPFFATTSEYMGRVFCSS
jgi:uncharacterized protein (TIGR03435 family)